MYPRGGSYRDRADRRVNPKLAEHLRQMKGVENVVKISKSTSLRVVIFIRMIPSLILKAPRLAAAIWSLWWSMRRGIAAKRLTRLRTGEGEADKCLEAARLSLARVHTASRALASKV